VSCSALDFAFCPAPPCRKDQYDICGPKGAMTKPVQGDAGQCVCHSVICTNTD
jgi:hypothetical protein